MSFVVIIPARLASTRLPRKPLADIGGAPMVVRVAQRAQATRADRVVVAADSEEIVSACHAHGIDAVLTSPQHETGTDRLAEAARLLGLGTEQIVVNVQGDEPLIPAAVIDDVARLLESSPDCQIATAAHAIADAEEFFNPNVVKVVTDRKNRALYFSRAPIPWARDAFAASRATTYRRPTRPAGMSACMPTGSASSSSSRRCHRMRSRLAERLEQLRALAHGFRIAVLGLEAALPPGVDTPADLEQVRALYAAQR